MHVLTRALTIRHAIGSSQERRRNLMLPFALFGVLMSPVAMGFAGVAIRALVDGGC